MNTFMNQNKNDTFSSLRGFDLQDLLVEINNNLLEYRNTLNLPKDVTFGVEIEYEKVSKTRVTNFIKDNLSTWTSKEDFSLYSGGEVSSPIMSDEISYWQELKTICEYLSSNKADTKHNAGGHVHIGANIIEDDVEAWKYFLKLYTAYESVIFRFAYGDKLSGRKKLLKYAPPISDSIYKRISKINDATTVLELKDYLPTYHKYFALNFCNIDVFELKSKEERLNTLEFRSPNATTNEVIWQNNINTFSKMLLSAKDKVMNMDFLDYKLGHEYVYYLKNEYLYNNINLKNALEFVDLVFDNNIDKMYFLRQYLKDFKNNYNFKGAVSIKRFVKR